MWFQASKSSKSYFNTVQTGMGWMKLDYESWLVVTGCHVWHFPINIGNVIIPIDALIFFRGVALAHQPDSVWLWSSLISWVPRFCPTGVTGRGERPVNACAFLRVAPRAWCNIFRRSHIHIFIYSYIHIFIYSYIHIFIYSYIHVFIYSYIHIFIYSYIHIFIYSYIHIFIFNEGSKAWYLHVLSSSHPCEIQWLHVYVSVFLHKIWCVFSLHRCFTVPRFPSVSTVSTHQWSPPKHPDLQVAAILNSLFRYSPSPRRLPAIFAPEDSSLPLPR